MVGKDPGELWTQYMRLVEVEEAFRNLKGDLGNPTDLASGREADRGACVRELPGVLPARKPEGPIGEVGAGTDPAGGAGEAGADPDGGRACPDDRRPGTGVVEIYGSYPGTKATDRWDADAVA